MGVLNKIPKTIGFLCVSIFFYAICLSIARIIFYFFFSNPGEGIGIYHLAKAFFIGFKFDLRIILVGHIPFLILAWLKRFSPFENKTAKKFWLFYFIPIFGCVVIFYIVDFGYYSYLNVRTDAAIIRFFHDFAVSFHMVWESYPVVWLVVLLVVLVGAYASLLVFLMNRIQTQQYQTLPKIKKILLSVLVIFLYLFGIYGKMSYYPLRWSDAFFSPNEFVSALAINPISYFFSTIKNQKMTYDIKAVRAHYPTMVKYLNIDSPTPEEPNYIRSQSGVPQEQPYPNVIMVFLESFAFHKTGLSQNPLNSTPNFDKIANNGYLFTKYYAPHSGTARSVFAAITGIPDVELNETSSRNPMVVRQHTIINAFKVKKKFYFLGGSASWGNIRGLLSYNLPGLEIFEEGSYQSPRNDVWGISDLNLFEEANAVLKKEINQPFFAIIQTSGNHRPYTIPEDNRGFKLVDEDVDTVKKHGFVSVEEYNSFRFLDHCVGFFMNLAATENYFKNTLFVFFGDHGIAGMARHMPSSEEKLTLTAYHVPMVLYGPKFIPQPQKFDTIASEVDLLPSIAGLLKVPCTNSTFGRNLFDDSLNQDRYAFTIAHRRIPELGLLNDQFYFRFMADGSNKRVNGLDGVDPTENLMSKYPDQAKKMEDLCRGIYKTAQYMAYHNSSETIAQFQTKNK